MQELVKTITDRVDDHRGIFVTDEKSPTIKKHLLRII